MSDEFDLLELEDLQEENKNIVDEASKDDTEAAQVYNISSYGADFDVDGLVKRLKRDDIIIPPFQRDYVWNLSDASRLIESILLGLPIPGVFFARDPDTNKLLVIDGQQRLKTLRYFFEGFFNPKENQTSKRVFKLTKVQKRFEDKTYETLDETDRIKLNDTVIHATIIKQESPDNDDTSVYHVFERLNTGGRKLTPQEIRSATFHGELISFLKELNQFDLWRKIYGPESKRLKDMELILRFIAFHCDGANYFKPMSEFLNKFCKRYRNPDDNFKEQLRHIFKETISCIFLTIGEKAFRPERALNTAVFDSVMIAIAKRIATDKNNFDYSKIKTTYEHLLQDEKYRYSIGKATSDPANVQIRMEIAISYFSQI